jgi:hypothetical protein
MKSVNNTKGRVLFIGPKSSGCPAKGRTSSGSCLVVQWLPRTSRYYLEDIQYVRWSHVRPLVQFAKRMSDGPPIHPYYRQQHTSARLSIRLAKSPNYPSSILNDPKPKLIPPTKPLMPS